MAMTMTIKRRGWPAPTLLFSLLAAIVIFGKPGRYSVPFSIGLSVIQLSVMIVAAGFLIVPAWRSRDDRRRQIALNGVLLIVPWALVTLMPGYGPPFASTLAMNHVRFVILFVSTAFLGAALFLLREPLTDEGGDRLLAPLGQASGVLATIIQLVWAAILTGWTMSEARKPPCLPDDVWHATRQHFGRFALLCWTDDLCFDRLLCPLLLTAWLAGPEQGGDYSDCGSSRCGRVDNARAPISGPFRQLVHHARHDSRYSRDTLADALHAGRLRTDVCRPRPQRPRLAEMQKIFVERDSWARQKRA